MKNIFKYSQSLLIAAMVTCPLLLTSCDDDDDVIVNPVPSEFVIELSSLNINWDETEGVIDIDANADWKATTTAQWITIDPNKGDPGEPRIYLSFDANNYLFPRTGQVEITCGEQTGTVTIVQAGCSETAEVEEVKFNVEVESLDYATTEIDLSSYAAQIAGNLGLTMDQFAAGVDDEGSVDFFMVKDGKWIEAGTAGTRCSAWLDRNLNVTNWNPNGYPNNACFLEVYGGDEATLVIGRAPGVPENSDFDLEFGFTLANDHSKYLIFKVNVKFPAMDRSGEIVETIDLAVNVEANNEYIPAYAHFDADAVAAALGASSVTLAKVVAYDEEGNFVPYTAGNGYWYDANGEICDWGEGAGWYIEYHGIDEEATEEDMTSWTVGPFPGTGDMHAVSKIGFWYNQRIVMFNIDVTVGPAVAE